MKRLAQPRKSEKKTDGLTQLCLDCSHGLFHHVPPWSNSRLPDSTPLLLCWACMLRRPVYSSCTQPSVSRQIPKGAGRVVCGAISAVCLIPHCSFVSRVSAALSCLFAPCRRDGTKRIPRLERRNRNTKQSNRSTRSYQEWRKDSGMALNECHAGPESRGAATRLRQRDSARRDILCAPKVLHTSILRKQLAF